MKIFFYFQVNSWPDVLPHFLATWTHSGQTVSKLDPIVNHPWKPCISWFGDPLWVEKIILLLKVYKTISNPTGLSQKGKLTRLFFFLFVLILEILVFHWRVGSHHSNAACQENNTSDFQNKSCLVSVWATVSKSSHFVTLTLWHKISSSQHEII